MSPIHRLRATARLSARRPLTVAVALLLLLTATTGSGSDAPERARPVRSPAAIPALTPALPAEIEWRATGLGFLELPLGLRARLDAKTTRNLYRSDDLSQAFLQRGGPEPRSPRALESRIALSRALSKHVELEVAWGARSTLAALDLFDFERQTVGARIRFVP